MNDFKPLTRGKGAKNGSGVVVKLIGRGDVTYETDGILYVIPGESCQDKDGTYSHILLCNGTTVYREGAIGIKIPDKIIRQMRRDLPKAFAAVSERCKIEPDETTFVGKITSWLRTK